MTEDYVERVKRYIAGYHAAWTELYERVSADGDFDAWADAMAEIGREHCVGVGNEMDRYSIGSPAAHDPDVETVLDSGRIGEDAYVVTQAGRYQYFDYELSKLGDQWRIMAMRQTAVDPRKPLMNADKLEELLDAPTFDNPETPVAEHEDPSNSLFEHGRPIESIHETGALEVRRVGELNLVSGVLVVQDFGYDDYNLAPLKRRLRPGRYPVDVSSVFGRNAAMRVCFGDPADVVAWHQVESVGDSHIRGVDAGNLAVFDLASFGALSVRDKERVYDATVVNPASYPAAEMMSLVHDDDGVVAHSGWGDGAYPLHWGVDGSGAPVVLLIDFLVACAWPTKDVELEVSEDSIGARLAHPTLDEHGIEISLDETDSGPQLTLVGEVSELKAIREDGSELCNIKWQGVTVSGDTRTYELPSNLSSELPWQLRVKLSRGYRNS